MQVIVRVTERGKYSAGKQDESCNAGDQTKRINHPWPIQEQIETLPTKQD